MALLDAWLAFSRDATHLQQFGQTDDESTFNGATGCTQTILQRLILAKTGDHVSHDEISKVAGYPWPSNNPNMRGLRAPTEVQRVFDHWHLPYEMVFGKTFDWVYAHRFNGPLMLGIRYGYWPEDRGYVYEGHIADGRPGGFAIRNGKTQFTGAENIYHATLWLGRRSVNGQERSYANEPNHGSGARPERPDYDTVLTSQVKRAYEQYTSAGRNYYAWNPTSAFKPKGY